MAGKPKRGRRQQDYALVDADMYAPADGVGVKAADPEPPKFVKVTVAIEDDDQIMTFTVHRAKTSLAMDKGEIKEVQMGGGVIAAYSVPEEISLTIKPMPEHVWDDWCRFETQQKPLAEKETDQ